MANEMRHHQAHPADHTRDGHGHRGDERGTDQREHAHAARRHAERTRLDRLAAIAAEAAEQTGRLDVPEIVEPVKLQRLIEGWEAPRRLLFCDEAGDAKPALQALGEAPSGPWAILIGPEGGFTLEEAEAVIKAGGQSVTLGPRILRAETAAIAGLSIVQFEKGDLGS